MKKRKARRMSPSAIRARRELARHRRLVLRQIRAGIRKLPRRRARKLYRKMLERLARL